MKQDYWASEITSCLTLSLWHHELDSVLARLVTMVIYSTLLRGRVAFRMELNLRKGSTRHPISCSVRVMCPFFEDKLNSLGK